MNSLSISRIHYEFTIYFANSLPISRIHYLFWEYTLNWLSISRIHYLFREFTIFFENSLWNDYLFSLSDYVIWFTCSLSTGIPVFGLHWPIFSLKWPFLTPDDLEWPWDAYHWIQKKISNRMVCISCVFSHITDFWPQMTFFDPIRWPRMTSRCKKMNSGENFQSNDMHIIGIWPYFRFLTPYDLFRPRKMTSDDPEMHKNELRRKFPIQRYAYQAYSI